MPLLREHRICCVAVRTLSRLSLLQSNTHLDLNLSEALAVVHTNDAADHLGDDEHVTKVGLDGGGLGTDANVLAL